MKTMKMQHTKIEMKINYKNKDRKKHKNTNKQINKTNK